LLSNAFTIAPDLQILNGGLKVYGRLVCLDSATTSGTTAENTFFYDGSTYEHRFFSVAGTPPIATWSSNSNFEITAYRTTKTLNNVLWSQPFGNVIYNCPDQATSASIEFAGRLQNIKGNFLIQGTGSGYIRLSLDVSNSTTITIGGDLIIEGRSRVWFSRGANTSVFIAGNFKNFSTATANCYVTTTGNCDINVAGNFEMNSTSPLRFASATASGRGYLRVSQDFIFQAGSINITNGGDGLGTIELNGLSSQLYTSLGSWTTGVNLLINNSTGVEVQGNSKVEGNVTVVSNGKLILPETNFILHGDLDLQSGGSVHAGNGTLSLAGSVNQNIILSGDTLHHININKSSGTSVTFSNSANLRGTLNVASTNTTAFSNGNLTLVSSSDDGSADAAINTLPTGSSISGDVNVQRYMSGEGRIYRYLSSPVSNATIESLMDDFPITGTFDDPSTGAGINSASPSFYYYDETLFDPLGWIAYPSLGLASENPMEAGRGYSAFIREGTNATTWDVTGTINQGDIELPVTYVNTNTPASDGWNLVGNPYPASIDWDVVNGWDKINIDNGIAIRDNGIDNFLYWDGAVGSLGSGRIAKGQSFWIKTNNANPQLTIKETAKTMTSTSFHRKKFSDPDYLEVSIQSSKHSDKTYLRLRDHSFTGYDSLDVPKFANDFINLSFEVDNISLAISAVDHIDCSQSHSINLSFAKKSDGSFVKSPVGNYELAISSFGLFATHDITLHDNFTNQDLNGSFAYSFSITEDPDSYQANRFTMHFKSRPLNNSTFVSADSVLCDNGSDCKIQLKNTQLNVRYKVFTNQNEIASYLHQKNDSAVIDISIEDFKNGLNTINVKANNPCSSKEIGTFKLWKQNTSKPDFIEKSACNTDTVSLLLKNVKDAIAFNWYDHNNDFLAQTQDSALIVSIQKPTTFFVSSVFNFGCISERSSLRVDVLNFEPITITENNGMLYSNYLSGNQWSLNSEELIGATQSVFTPTTSGKYSLTIYHNTCIDSVSYQFTYQDDAYHVFPNPVEDDVQIIAPISEKILQIEVINAAGQSVGIFSPSTDSKTQVISLDNLNPGIYLLKVLTSETEYRSRILKQ
ncbi:MAG TPA: T9SS type A sorting domain-containing protein, partial [Chryseolinea sp.]|nr:T9SS type A sorting domain-containing protein [Chryseolinea sp.]